MKSIGKIVHFDLTVEHAEEISQFYKDVVGWKITPLSMGDYDDYVLTEPNTGEGLGGICHARGSNAYIPPQWLMYVGVENLEESLDRCRAQGGAVLGDIRKYGDNVRYCLIQDPAGAHLMLYEDKEK